MSLLERFLDRIFEKRVIVNCDHDPYLHRWYVIRTKRVGLFIHKFVRSDEDRALHDHPWSFLVIPLWGGYIEHSDRPFDPLRLADWGHVQVIWKTKLALSGEKIPYREDIVPERVPVRRRVRPLISTRYRDTTYRHRVELVKERPSWSLFFRFTKIREWGFWPKEGFILWNKWWQDKCE